MAGGIVVADAQALERVIDTLGRFSADNRELVWDTIRDMGLLEIEWDDEDFRTLMEYLKSFMQDVDIIDANAKEIMDSAYKKIEALRKIHKETI